MIAVTSKTRVTDFACNLFDRVVVRTIIFIHYIPYENYMEVNTLQPTETEAYLDDAVAEYIYARNSIQTSFLF